MEEKAMSEAVQIASATMYPLAFMLIAYPAFIPSFLGEAYLPASAPIIILAPLVNGYTYYAYALGEYRQVTLIGLVGNLPRMILYLLLIRELAEVGAATSFSLGFLFSLLAVIPLAKRMNYRLNLKETVKISVIPLAFYMLALTLGLPPIIGIPLILILSYISYARPRILLKKT